MKQDLSASERAFMMQGLSDEEALSEGLIDMDDFPSDSSDFADDEYEDEYNDEYSEEDEDKDLPSTPVSIEELELPK